MKSIAGVYSLGGTATATATATATTTSATAGIGPLSTQTNSFG